MKLVNKPSRPTLTIEFTPEECDILAIICAKIGGDVNLSPRKVTENLASILGENGYEWSTGPFVIDGRIDYTKLESDGIYFKNPEGTNKDY